MKANNKNLKRGKKQFRSLVFLLPIFPFTLVVAFVSFISIFIFLCCFWSCTLARTHFHTHSLIHLLTHSLAHSALNNRLCDTFNICALGFSLCFALSIYAISQPWITMILRSRKLCAHYTSSSMRCDAMRRVYIWNVNCGEKRTRKKRRKLGSNRIPWQINGDDGGGWWRRRYDEEQQKEIQHCIRILT